VSTGAGESSLQAGESVSPILESNEEIVDAVYAGIRKRPDPVDLEITVQLDFPTNAKPVVDSIRTAESIREAIVKLGDLPPDYDGHGADPVSRDAIDAAKWLVSNLFSLRAVLPHTVAPLAEGGVELEFENPWIYFDIWVFSPRNVRFLARRGETSECWEGPVYEVLDKLWNAIARESSGHQAR
jgi:hypothetical protein